MTLRLERQLAPRRSVKGFTLIELLVVIAIIGILAAVVLVSLNTARVRGRDARRLSDLQAVSLAMELYADANTGNYPDDGNTTGPNATAFTTVGSALESAGYIPSTPRDPLSGRNYFADVSGSATGNRNSYLLAADLEAENQACDSDYDGPNLEPAGAPARTCGPDVAADCADAETDSVDYCICQGPDCA